MTGINVSNRLSVAYHIMHRQPLVVDHRPDSRCLSASPPDVFDVSDVWLRGFRLLEVDQAEGRDS